ncbi:MAG: hypothetical protein C0421_05770 [Hyphomonas sp.]|nr:hypothetical protein [Hyphomonas sp.]
MRNVERTGEAGREFLCKALAGAVRAVPLRQLAEARGGEDCELHGQADFQRGEGFIVDHGRLRVPGMFS